MNTSNNRVYYFIFNTQFGYLGILASEKGLRSIVLPHKNKNAVYKKLIKNLNNKQAVLKENKEKLNDYYMQILGYLNGISKSFRVKLDLQGYSKFSKAVWNIAQEIPYGETRTYNWIAMKMGKPQSARAVGNALGKNPIPIIIPCHRVLKKDGSIGGFSAGLDWKKFLLNLEKQNLKKFNTTNYK